MPPDESFPQQNSQIPPTVAPKNKSNLVIILVGILVFVVVTAAVSTLLLINSSKSKDKEVESAKQELTAAKNKIEDLDNPQKKENDAQRKTDLARFAATLNEYAANNNGAFPSTEPSFFAKDFEAKYITGKLRDFVDPQTKEQYKLIPVANVQTPPGVTLGTIQYQWPAKCQGSEFDDKGSARQAAVRLILESGEIYCLDT